MEPRRPGARAHRCGFGPVHDLGCAVRPDPGGRQHPGNTARDSQIAQEDENEYRPGDDSVAYPAYTERGLGFFRAYYSYVPKGHFWFEYTLRLNNPGKFSLPPTRVEAMYAPEVFGQYPNASLTVRQK